MTLDVREASPLFVVGLALAGCFGDGSGDSPPIQPTLIAVSPDDFVGSVPCARDPGALQSYIATFYDVGDVESLSPAGSGVPLFSSPPVDCRRSVGTQNVIDDHHYAVELHAFDRPACGAGVSGDCLRALSPGVPVAADQDGNVVAPRWTTACGRGEHRTVLPVDFTTIYVHECDELMLDPADTESSIRLAVDDSLGALSCGSEPGLVDRFSVLPGQPALDARDAACGDVLEFSTLDPGREYVFRLEAFEAGATSARWASSCRAGAVAGARVDAVCTPLTSRGAIVLELAELLGSSCGDDGTRACECGTDFQSVGVSLPDEPEPELLTGQACRQTLSIPADSGSYTFVVELTALNGEQTRFTCQADVAPLRDEPASCAAAD